MSNEVKNIIAISASVEGITAVASYIYLAPPDQHMMLEDWVKMTDQKRNAPKQMKVHMERLMGMLKQLNF